MEMIVDEMLAILNDRDVYVQKQIEKNRRIDLDDLFIRGFDIRWNEELQDSYVYQIPAIANIDHFEFESNITFFVGENGSGKSTLLEAFAVACGLNPEGGTANYRFSTYDDYSDLASAIKIRKGDQFVIVTHSPILLAIPDADIFSFDEGSIRQIRYEDTESYQITKMFLDNREYMLKRLLAEDEE